MINQTITSKIKKQEKDIGDLKIDVDNLNKVSSALQQQFSTMKAKEILQEFPTFSHLMRKMAREQDYPTWEYRGFIEFFINDKDKREALKKAQVLMSFEREGKEQWILGPAGIQIVNSWKANELSEKTNQLNESTNQLNKRISTLTTWVIRLMIIQIIIAVVVILM